MTDIILTGAKYLIIVLFAYFTYLSFRAQRDVPEERKKTVYLLQRVTLLLIHALAFLSICINITLYDTIDLEMGKVIGLYAGQLVYLLVMTCVIPRFVPISKGLNNVMCMFLVIGFIMQTRLDFDTSLRQFTIALVSSVVFLIFVFLCRRARFMRNMTYLYAAIGMALLATVLVLSRVVNGAKLAIDLGFFSFQPAEFVKILFVLFAAAAFYHANDTRTVLITAAVAAIHVLILVFCHDLGSALILFMIYILMLYAATKKIRYVGIGLGALIAGGIASYYFFSHVKVRITAWRDPWSTIDSNGYQIAQALFAIGTGGWFGSGLFGGAPRTVPMVSNDMIFSAISEELGGIFAILLVLLCLCFILMIFRVAMRVNNTFYKLLAFGLGAAYGFQVFLTIGGTTKFIPLTGVNLPFISSGGSSILTAFIMIGMVQALYVISEADVEREKEMVAAGMHPLASQRIEHMRPEEPERPAYGEEEYAGGQPDFRVDPDFMEEPDHGRETDFRVDPDFPDEPYSVTGPDFTEEADRRRDPDFKRGRKFRNAAGKKNRRRRKDQQSRIEQMVPEKEDVEYTLEVFPEHRTRSTKERKRRKRGKDIY